MSQTEQRDPRQGAKPPFPEQEQPYPGSDAELRPTADHGEESYRGSGKLEGLATIVTGGDSGIGRAVAIAFAREGADVLISHLDEEATPRRRRASSRPRGAAVHDPRRSRRSGSLPARRRAGRSRSSAVSTSS